MRYNDNISNSDLEELQRRNTQKLIEIKKYPFSQTDGEETISRTLDKLGIMYIPEFYIPKLNGDNHNYRIADFYLPSFDLYIEFLGNWNTNESHQRRYKQKMAVYNRSNIDCIYIYPNNLYNITSILSARIRDFGKPPFETLPETTNNKQWPKIPIKSTLLIFFLTVLSSYVPDISRVTSFYDFLIFIYMVFYIGLFFVLVFLWGRFFYNFLKQFL